MRAMPLYMRNKRKICTFCHQMSRTDSACGEDQRILMYWMLWLIVMIAFPLLVGFFQWRAVRDE